MIENYKENNDIEHTVMSKQVFNRVIMIWRQQKCLRLKLELSQPFDSIIKVKPLTIPSITKEIIGDGNCLYKA